ncbi:Ig-like domain-containing protein [Agaribacter flavus]|uniref:Ig-like domain-containing protein n=1 Tax=Agaribacter flavus TaxID=1902781 RepID=A0ABV7FPN1_9ALTE
MRSTSLKLTCLAMSVAFSLHANANTQATVNINVQHSVDGHSEFDRSKYIVMHDAVNGNEWNNSQAELDYLMSLNVYFGRDNGTINWVASQVNEDPNRPGYADPNHLQSYPVWIRNNYANAADRNQYDDRSQSLMVGGQLHPMWAGDSVLANTHTGAGGWSFANNDAIGEYMGLYLNHAYRPVGSTDVSEGHPNPPFLEIVNEPLFEYVDTEGGDPLAIFNYHNEVASAVRRVNSDVLIGGYTTAFPIFEERDFARWEERMKLFIDTSGEHMDFFSIHLYDFNTIWNRETNQCCISNVNFKGSRIEATLDLMEQYSLLALGEVKPFIISEYGGRDHELEVFQDWSANRDWHFMKSFSPMMMQFMAKPDRMLKTVPFVLTKALWHSEENGNKYDWRLLREVGEAEGETGSGYVFTEQIKFFELWSDVVGNRVDARVSNSDVLIDAYVNDNKVYLALSNLNENDEVVSLNMQSDSDAVLQNVRIKHLHIQGSDDTGVPVLTESQQSESLSTFTLGREASAVIEFTYDKAISLDQTSTETKYYADTYLQEIAANQADVFNINDVSVSEFGEAILRVGLGREHGKSLQPTVRFNGASLAVPSNVKGDDQANRDQFFGLLEIPVSNSLLQDNNVVEITFSDDGGHVSSVSLQQFTFSDELRNTSLAVTGVSLTPASLTLTEGESESLTVAITPDNASNTNLSFSSSNTAVATVSEAGQVTAVSAGSATITVTTEDGGFSSSTTVTVNAPATTTPPPASPPPTQSDSSGGGGSTTWLVLGLLSAFSCVRRRFRKL